MKSKTPTTPQDLLVLEKQLSCPQDKQGIALAHQMHNTNQSMTNTTIALLQPLTGKIVVEIGHGNCHHLNVFFKDKKAGPKKYIGIERSKTMWQEALSYAKKQDLQHQTRFLYHTQNTFVFLENTVDVIFSVNTIYFWQNPKQYIKQLYTALKPKGSLALSFADKTFMQTLPFVKDRFTLYNHAMVKTLLQEVGFINIQARSYNEKVRNKINKEVTRIYWVVSATK